MVLGQWEKHKISSNGAHTCDSCAGLDGIFAREATTRPQHVLDATKGTQVTTDANQEEIAPDAQELFGTQKPEAQTAPEMAPAIQVENHPGSAGEGTLLLSIMCYILYYNTSVQGHFNSFVSGTIRVLPYGVDVSY